MPHKIDTLAKGFPNDILYMSNDLWYDDDDNWGDEVINWLYFRAAAIQMTRFVLLI